MSTFLRALVPSSRNKTLLELLEAEGAVEFHLSGTSGTANQPNMQKIRIIGFSFENRLHTQFEVGEKFIQMTVLGYIFIYTYLLTYSMEQSPY